MALQFAPVSSTTQTRSEMLQEWIEDARRGLAPLESVYRAAQKDIESGAYEEKRREVAEELFSRIMEYNHKQAHALDANHLLWWAKERIEELAKPLNVIQQYEDLRQRIKEWGEQLTQALPPEGE
jgi:hypothetical protein